MKYQFKPGYWGPRTVPADVIGPELTRLEATGGLTAKRFVEAARPSDAPLHALLEWDDLKAADAHRENQARTIIRSIEVVHEPKGPAEPKEIHPAFIHVPDRNAQAEGRYVNSAILAENPDQIQRALEEALRYLASSEKSVHFIRRLLEGQEDSVAAQIALAHEGFHLVRAALEGLQQTAA
jgi:hypothetical protein